MTELQYESGKKVYKLGYIEGYVSIILNLLLFAGKFYIGKNINSVSLKADAWHTLSDSVTSLILLAGLYISSKPPDTEHPFGHGRVEKITSLIIGLLLALVAANFFKDSVIRIHGKVVITFTLASILIQALCAVLKQGLAIFSFWAGNKVRMQALIADGWHHQSDALTSVLFLVGVALSGRIPMIDGYLGILISLTILWTAFDIIKNSISPLLGENVSDEMINKVLEEVSKIDPRISSLHHFHVHKYGRHVELTFHLRLPKEITLEESHRITQEIEKILISYNINATIHVEPY
ncbi:MAG TPA: cation diffusion facilitator family transporter [Candidatus Hydrothermia bacterium]|nr:cation diffusion facilitator family transporter [Candidatus Hydrothermia bacterium]